MRPSRGPRLPLAIVATMTWVCAQAAQADVTVTFIEGAPTDRFEITSDGACEEGAVQLMIDLASSAGGLIFDVTGAGQGVEVYQPLRVVSGAEHIETMTPVTDGSTHVSLSLRRLPGRTPVAFTADLDDTVEARQIIVSGAEIAGASATLVSARGTVTAVFDAQAVAVIRTEDCLS